MHYLLPMLAGLAIGMVILMACILITRGHGQSLQSALNESFIWGTAFFLSFGTEAFILFSQA